MVLEDSLELDHGESFFSRARLNGSYWALNRDELRRIRRICGSVKVAQRARKSTRNITNPLKRLAKKLKVAPPMTTERKNSRRSAPAIVSGLLRDLYVDETWVW